MRPLGVSFLGSLIFPNEQQLQSYRRKEKKRKGISEICNQTCRESRNKKVEKSEKRKKEGGKTLASINMASQGSLGVQRVLAKLEASINSGNYYEAHQMYRTLHFR